MFRCMLVCLFVSLIGCGEHTCKNADFTLPYRDICVYTHGYDITKEEIRTALTLIEEAVIESNPENYSLVDITQEYSDVSIHFKELPDEPYVNGKTKRYYGSLENDSFKIIINTASDRNKKGKCFVYRTLDHEMLHVFLITVENDGTHDNNDWFLYDGESVYEHSLEWQIWLKIQDRLCNE